MQINWKNGQESVIPLLKRAVAYIWEWMKWVVAKAITIAIANPLPVAIVIAVFALTLLVIWLWPSSDSINQKKADNAAEQGITKTAEVEQQKEVTANVEEQIEGQEKRVEAANTNVVVAGSRTKAARERAVETAKAAQRAQERTEKALQTDSSKYSNTNTGERFCKRFPSDSTCTLK